MIDWNAIETILLDMDGTLLDLRFDNHFWKEFVPQKFAEKQGWPLETAKEHLIPRFKSKEGTLEWYCLDFWSENLQLDIAGLKAELAELISVLPHAGEFLEKMKRSSRRVMLVTNAHRDSLNLKMEKTGLLGFFDEVVSSHDYRLPKENPEFWHKLNKEKPFAKEAAVLIDDSLPVLRSANEYGIAHLVSITRPDTGMPKRETGEFTAIEDFRELMPGF